MRRVPSPPNRGGASVPLHDVVILGGGPAGVAAALALKQVESGLRVLLVEAEPEIGWRIGETLVPGTRQILQTLGCWDAVIRAGVEESFQSIAAWGDSRPHQNEFVFSMRGNAAHVDRARFNDALRAVAEAADVVVWRPARFQAAERRKDGRWYLTLSRHDELRVVLADAVVDATGRHAGFAATQGSRPRFADRLVGVAGLIEPGPGARPRDCSMLVEAREAGWWYSSPIPGGRLVLVWMSDADLIHQAGLARPERWLAHLRAAPLIRRRTFERTMPDKLITWPARSCCLDSVCGPGWVAVGDAASVWDPLSSAGILKALRTGKLGAFAILDLLSGKADGMAKYRRCIEADYAHYQRHRQQIYRLEQRWRRSPFWQRRDGSDSTPAMQENPTVNLTADLPD